MTYVTCWEKMDCGKGPDSENPCIVVDHQLSDGFLGGKNGSKACFFIRGTTCFPDDKDMKIPEKFETYCQNCKFYKETIAKEGVQANLFFYYKHIHDKLAKENRVEELPLINLQLFHS